MTTMNTVSTADKRRHPRIALGVTMDISASGRAGQYRGTIADLSAGGMSFKSDAVLEQGMCLHLRLAPVEIRGEVRHAKDSVSGQHRYGVRFHKIKLAGERA